MISQSLKAELVRLNQRSLTKGETFLLAKAVADSLPLAPADTDNIKLFVLVHRRIIESSVYELCNYTYLESDEVSNVLKLVEELSLWRCAVAHNPPSILFRGDGKNVVDDVSCLLNYVDTTYLCAVGDIIDNANYMFDLFKRLVAEIKTEVV